MNKHKETYDQMARRVASQGLPLFAPDFLSQLQNFKPSGDTVLVKEKKLKNKKFYHTFELGERTVTLCLLVNEKERNLDSFLTNAPTMATLEVGYAVCHPDDEFNEELAKKISLGRAEKDKSRLEDMSYGLPIELAFDLGILKGFALRAERLIAQGRIQIKGIRDVE